MSEKMIKRNEWNKVINFYQQVDGFGFNVVEVELATNIAELYGHKLYPYTSHRALCVSTSTKFDQFHEFPKVSILHLGNKEFQVEFWGGLWKEGSQEVYKVKDNELWNLLQKLFSRLLES